MSESKLGALFFRVLCLGEIMEDKIIDILKKKNLELKNELEHIKQYSESEESQKAKELINECSCVKADWEILLNDLQKKRDEYSKLINDLHTAKETFENLYKM